MIVQANLASLNGLLILNKPRGVISKDVSRRLERFLGKKVRLGHVGTLDPEADGVLPLLFGQATKLQDYLLDSPKTYEFELEFGYETTTLDVEGEVIKESTLRTFPHTALESQVHALVGKQTQVPPLYSAVKYKGRPLYDYARKNESDAIDWSGLAREVEVYSSRLLSYDGGARAVIEAHCSKGTYVRILARDIAYALGSCATVVALKRTACAGARIEDAYSLDFIEEQLKNGESLSQFLVPIERMVLDFPSISIDSAEDIGRLLNGQHLRFSSQSLLYDDLRKQMKSFDPCFECTLLLRGADAVIGLGKVKGLGSDSIEIAMKRSLR